LATGSADFIALIDQNRMVGNYTPKDFELKLIEGLRNNQNYRLIKHLGHFYLYQKVK
jgi:hypothetical protein